jgi:hypothetical protein
VPPGLGNAVTEAVIQRKIIAVPPAQPPKDFTVFYGFDLQLANCAKEFYQRQTRTNEKRKADDVIKVMTEVVRASEEYENFYETTRCNRPKS